MAESTPWRRPIFRMHARRVRQSHSAASRGRVRLGARRCLHRRGTHDPSRRRRRIRLHCRANWRPKFNVAAISPPGCSPTSGEVNIFGNPLAALDRRRISVPATHCFLGRRPWRMSLSAWRRRVWHRSKPVHGPKLAHACRPPGLCRPLSAHAVRRAAKTRRFRASADP